MICQRCVSAAPSWPKKKSFYEFNQNGGRSFQNTTPFQRQRYVQGVTLTGQWYCVRCQGVTKVLKNLVLRANFIAIYYEKVATVKVHEHIVPYSQSQIHH